MPLRNQFTIKGSAQHFTVLRDDFLKLLKPASLRRSLLLTYNKKFESL